MVWPDLLISLYVLYHGLDTLTLRLLKTFDEFISDALLTHSLFGCTQEEEQMDEGE